MNRFRVRSLIGWLALLLLAAMLARADAGQPSASACAVAPGVERAPGTPFATEDSIRLTRVLTLDGRVFPTGSRPLENQFALFSPDARQFVVRTRRGDPVSDRNCEQLLLWTTDEVRRTNRPVPPRRLLARSFAADRGAIDGLLWLDNQRLRFMAEDEAGVIQAYLLDAKTAKLTQLTRSPTDIVGFATGGGATLHFAREPARAPEKVVNGWDATIYSLTESVRRSEDSIQLFARQGSGAAVPLGAGFVTADPAIHLAPDGRHAVVFHPEVDPPAHWRGYRTRTRGYTDIDVRDPRDPENALRLRALLVDLETGRVRPLLDAPAGHLAGNGAPQTVYWTRDGRSVILSNTYLPRGDGAALPTVDHPVIAEVELATGRATAIADLPVAKPGERLDGAVSTIDYDVATGVLRLSRRVEGHVREESYERVDGSWRAGPLRSAQAGSEATKLEVWVAQSPSSRPKLVAALGEAPARVLYDPAPELDRHSFGRQERIFFRFLDTDREAALIYPVGYKPGTRYPLVVQTHGLGKDEFLIDGPHGATTAYAAQPLANQGFAVLQLPDIRTPGYNSSAEASENAAYWKAAVDHVVGLGVADRGRVGVIAWSRTGFHLLAALALYPDLFTAASISDSVQYGGLSQILAMPGRRDRVASHAENTSGEPFTVPLERWITDGNPFYTSAASKTPLRVEAIGSPIPMWETFAVRRIQQQPVDFVYYPQGSHSLVKPSERLASQGGSVDWFRFWLEGEEDPDPAKAGQYARWRAMRDARKAPAQ